MKVAIKLYLWKSKRYNLTVWLMLVWPPSPPEQLVINPPPTNRTCVILSTVVAWCLFIRYYRKVRSSICISQKPYNGIKQKKLHWKYTTRLIFPLSLIISTQCDPRNKKKRKAFCISLGRSGGGGQNKMHITVAISGTSSIDWMGDRLYESTNPKKAPLGARLALPTSRRLYTKF